jgi:hypothetical protein
MQPGLAFILRQVKRLDLWRWKYRLCGKQSRYGVGGDSALPRLREAVEATRKSLPGAASKTLLAALRSLAVRLVLAAFRVPCQHGYTGFCQPLLLLASNK